MPYDSQGVFTRVMNWQEDAANSVPIVASRHDDEDDNFAQGFNEVLCRDGRAPMTGALKMGSFKITGLANGTTNNDAVNKSQLDAQNTSLTTAISTAITNCKNALFPVGSLYSTIGNTNPNTILGFGTWALLTSSIITEIESTAPVKGDGKALSMTNGTQTFSLATRGSETEMIHSASGYGQAVGSGSVPNENYYANAYAGLSTDATKSGVIADTSSLATSKTIYIWERTA
jgi:hypothetical protein